MLWITFESMLREAYRRTGVMALAHGYRKEDMDMITDDQAYAYNMGPGVVGMLQRMLEV